MKKMAERAMVENWSPEKFVEWTIPELKAELGDDKVVLGLSGGVDSTVTAVLLHRAIGNNLLSIFVDTGLMRKDEPEEVMEQYGKLGLNVICVRAADRFLGELKGVTDPEQKRKIIGHMFIELFDEEAQRLDGIKWLGQGTIYPDILESLNAEGKFVKSHHNVGGLPDKMNLGIVEPLRLLYKDEVRRIGKFLGVADELLGRHPFPGPGLGVRILGEITAERVAILQNADRIFMDALRREGLYDKIWQAGVILLPVQATGVKNGERTYGNAVALRAVHSVNAITANVIELPYAFLTQVAKDIINNVEGVNRVVYDISPKPPATIEWE